VFGAEAKDPAVQAFDQFLAFEIGIVVPKLIGGHDEGLDVAYVREILGRHYQVFQARIGLAYKLFGTFAGGGENYFSGLAVFAGLGTAGVHLLEPDGLGVGVMGTLFRSGGFARRHQFREVLRGLGGGQG